MDFLHKIVEERIQKAQQEGVFDNLPGKGGQVEIKQIVDLPESIFIVVFDPFGYFRQPFIFQLQ